jgi:hypothetical protein
MGLGDRSDVFFRAFSDVYPRFKSQAATPVGAAPGHAPDWNSIHWKKVWRTVRRLQARIVKAVLTDWAASREGRS